jgi:glycerophosphoryl diester phosphodiesterase
MARRVRGFWLVLLGSCLLGCSSDGDDGPSKPNRLLSDEILSIAHGGAAIAAPKQTLLAYQMATEANADVLEVDIHSTLDGVLVVIHDETVDATTDGTGSVKEQTFEQLRELDAGYAFSKDGGFPYRGQGLTIPSLEELLDAFPEAYWVIEIKQDDPPLTAPLLALLRAKKAEQRVIIASFKDAVMADVRAQAPEIFTSLSTAEAAELLFLTPEQEPSWSSPARFVQPPFGLTDQTRVDRAHRLGLKVHPWTVNDPEEMHRLIALGVDGIITDDPATLEALTAE